MCFEVDFCFDFGHTVQHVIKVVTFFIRHPIRQSIVTGFQWSHFAQDDLIAVVRQRLGIDFINLQESKCKSVCFEQSPAEVEPGFCDD